MNDTQPATALPPLTKIVATIGPATAERSALRGLIEAGAAVFRLNFSHGSLDDHQAVVEGLRAESEAAGRVIAIMGDLPGLKVRVGPIEGAGVEVRDGDTAIFQRPPIPASTGTSPHRFNTTYEGLIDDVKVGDRVLVNEGVVRMRIVEVRKHEIVCTVTTGGVVSSGKGVNLPDSRVNAPVPTERDAECVRWAIDHDLDFLAQSFVRSAEDISRLRTLIARELERSGRVQERLPIIAKIEHPAALQEIEAIIDAADGIIIARGDLGVETELARVPVMQRMLTAAAQAAGKPCLVATHMLESMIDAPAPTRAEVSDVATAVFAGADAVMLSGETAIGKFPARAVEFMVRIAREVEQAQAAEPPAQSPPAKPMRARHRTAALAHGAFTIAADYGAKFIAVWSQQGGGARLLSQNNFTIPILAFSSDRAAVCRMQILRGVCPVPSDPPRTLSGFTAMVDRVVLEAGWARRGDRCILIAGGPLGTQGVTNTLALHEVGCPDSGFICHGDVS